MSVVSLPIETSNPNQEFSVVLGELEYSFTFQWSMSSGAWFFSVSLSDGTELAYGQKVVLGAVLLRLIPDRRTPAGLLRAVDTTSRGTEATLDNFGEHSIVQIWFYDLEELAS